MLGWRRGSEEGVAECSVLLAYCMKFINSFLSRTIRDSEILTFILVAYLVNSPISLLNHA